MNFDLNQAISLLITFATILSHYWHIKIQLNNINFRIKTIEQKNISFDELDKKIYKIELLLEHLEKKLTYNNNAN